MGIDYDRLFMFDYDPLIVESLMNQWSRLIYNNMKKYDSELAMLTVFAILNPDSEYSFFKYLKKRKDNQITASDYIEKYDGKKQYRIHHVSVPIYDFDDITLSKSSNNL